MTVVTDHRSLTYFHAQPNLSRRQARWMEFLQSFDLEIKYTPGKGNVVADALSRHALDGLQLSVLSASKAESTLLHRIKTAYQNEDLAKNILKGREVPEDFTVKEGVIFVNRNGRQRIYVPDDKNLRQDILFQHHDVDICAHLGMDKTLELIDRTFFWPSIKADVREYIRSCPLCQANKSTNRHPIGLLQPLATPSKRWQEVTMDLITQLPKTRQGHDAIAVFVDRLTKMTHFVPTKTSVTATQLAHIFFDEVYKHHGMPKVIVSDRDTRFTSIFWRELFKKCYGTKLAMSTANHPQTDGQTERANRTLEDMLRSYVNVKLNDWDEHLSAVEFAYNNSKQASTGYTPFFLNYGRHPCTTTSLVVKDEIENEASNQAAIDFIKGWEQDIVQAKKNLEAAQQRQARFADSSRRDHKFKVDDLVLLNGQHLKALGSTTSKLNARFLGPFKIIEMVSPVAARLELPPNMKNHPVIHVSQLKPFIESSKFPRETKNTRPPPDIRGGGEYYQVEAIVKKKTVGTGPNKTVKYLVKWHGYPSYESTWIPQKELTRTEDLRKMLKEFEETSDRDVAF